MPKPKTKLGKIAWESAKILILAIIGGCIYYRVEILWRGYSHWSMAVVGGICFILMGLINRLFPWEMSFLAQMMIAGYIITLMELISGIIFNMWLGMGIWDYSGISYNILGQICASYVMFWQWLSTVGIVLDDATRWLLGEEKPTYKLF